VGALSGRTIGTVLGAAIGFWIGGPAGASFGATLGGIAGGVLMPDHLQGVQLDDIPVQTSVSGNPRAIVLGTSVVKGTRIIWESKARIVTEEDQQGKGGPVIENDVAYQDFGIEVCESSELRGTKVDGIAAVWEDGILVYDTRPGALVSAADSAKWKTGVTFYFGDETQLPDPTAESVFGVGQVPAYRGTCSMVFANRKISPRNSISNYEVLVSKCAIDESDAGFPTHLLITGSEKLTGGPVFATAKATATPTFVGLELATGADLAGASADYYGGVWAAFTDASTRYSSDEMVTWQTGTIAASYAIGPVVGLADGWLATGWDGSNSGESHSDASVFPTAMELAALTGQYSNGDPGQAGAAPVAFKADGYYYLARNANRALFRSATLAGPFNAVWDVFKEYATGRNINGTDTIVGFYDAAKFDGEWHIIIGWGFTSRRFRVIKCADIADLATFTVLVDVAVNAASTPAQLCAGEDAVVSYCTDATLWTSADSWASPIATGLDVTAAGGDVFGSVLLSGGRRIQYGNGLFYAIGSTDTLVTFDPATLAVSTLYTLPITGTVSIVAGTHTIDPAYLPIPDADGHYIDPITGATDGPSPGVSTSCGTTLDEVFSLVTRLCDIPDAQVDVTELEDIPVRGITIQTLDPGRAILEPVQQTWFVDLPEFDGKLRAHLRGQASTDVAIDVNHLLDTGDEDEDWRRGQMVSYPRRHHLGYMSLDLDYVVTDATVERTSPDIRVVGETSIASVGVHTDEEATQIADKQMKVAWTEREGLRKFGLPLEYLRIVGASIVTLENRRWRIDNYRVDNMAIYIEGAVYDRASAYTSTASGPTRHPPTPPPTTIRGPTDSVLLNVPVLRDTDDMPGIYWAPRGFPDTAWNGAFLQRLRGAAWETVDSTMRACNTGTLLSDLPANDGPIDELHTIQIRLSSGMDSITFAQFLNEGNPLAIQYPDGKAEIIQVQFATEISDDVYDCTRLIRGRLDTVNGEHLAGARVVFLNSAIRFIPLMRDDLGQTLSFRSVSNDTDPSAASTQTITLATIESWREWQPYNITATADVDCQWTVDFVERPRLGTDANPVQSQWWDGYRIDFTVGSVTKSRFTRMRPFFYSAALQVEDWGAASCTPYDITVTSLSR
jgi:hypothetical protein